MSIKPITQPAFFEIRKLLNLNSGIALNDDHAYLVETRLSDLGNEMGVATFGELFDRVRTNPKEMLPKIIHRLSTHETFWFRDKSFWNTLEKLILPKMFERLRLGTHRIRVWSAGCSTGQEPYSLAILIDELCQQRGTPTDINRFSILATDISEVVISTAKTAQYNTFDIERGLSKCRQNNYFIQQEKNNWKLREDICRRVEFRQINLIEDFTKKVGPFDIVLCRNVIIYFSPDFKKKFISKLVQVLANEGILFFGASESLRGYSEQLRISEFEGGFYYQRS